MKVIRDEYADYKTIFFRKSVRYKVIETLVFIVLVLILLGFVEPSTTEFKVGAISAGVLTLGLSPLLFKLIVRPRHILTDNELILERYGKRRVVALGAVEETNDLRFFYKIEGKKMPLMISDDFIADLDSKLDQLKREKKR